MAKRLQHRNRRRKKSATSSDRKYLAERYRLARAVLLQAAAWPFGAAGLSCDDERAAERALEGVLDAATFVLTRGPSNPLFARTRFAATLLRNAARELAALDKCDQEERRVYTSAAQVVEALAACTTNQDAYLSSAIEMYDRDDPRDATELEEIDARLRARPARVERLAGELRSIAATLRHIAAGKRCDFTMFDHRDSALAERARAYIGDRLAETDRDLAYGVYLNSGLRELLPRTKESEEVTLQRWGGIIALERSRASRKQTDAAETARRIVIKLMTAERVARPTRWFDRARKREERTIAKDPPVGKTCGLS
jgi:hypothetical protein